MKKYIVQLFVLLFVLKGLSQHRMDLNEALDTIYLKEFTLDSLSANSKSLVQHIDSMLENEGWMKHLDTTEGYFIHLTSDRFYYVPYDEKVNADYYVSISKMKRQNSRLNWQRVIGFFEYKKKLFFIEFDSCVNDIFIHGDKQKPFLFYDLKEIYKLDIMKYYEFQSWGSGFQFKVHNEVWDVFGGAVEVKD